MIRERPLPFLVGSIALFTVTLTYALSLDEWGDTKGAVFLVVGILSLAVAGIAVVQLIGQWLAHRQGR